MKDSIDALAFAALFGVTGQVGMPCRARLHERDARQFPDDPNRTRAQWRHWSNEGR